MPDDEVVHPNSTGGLRNPSLSTPVEILGQMSDHDAANGRTGTGTGKPVVVAVVTSPLGVLIGRRADGHPPWTFIGGKHGRPAAPGRDCPGAAGGRAGYSPEGAVRVTLRPTGVPKFGVPSAFQVNFWARVERFMSQLPFGFVVPW
jgi:hypothetical protein